MNIHPMQAAMMALGDRMRSQNFDGHVNEHGQPVKRAKYSHPYNYDGFVLWDNRKAAKTTGTVYSDRLLGWDCDKHNRLCEKHFGNQGQHWDRREPAKIEAFLRDWHFDQELTLTMIMEYCNQSSGYPCWRFDFHQGASE